MGVFSSTGQPHESQTVCIENDSSRRQRGGSGGEWSGGEGREGEGRAGQGSRLLRWTFTGRDFIPLNTPVERAAT